MLKHAKPFASGWKTLSLDINRIGFEYEALTSVESLLLSEAARCNIGDKTTHQQYGFDLVHVPHVFHYDRNMCVMILEDAGDVPTLKSFLHPLSSPTNPITLEHTTTTITVEHSSRKEISQQIGAQLGSFLAFLHTIHLLPSGASLKEKFSCNQGARELCAWRTAARLKDFCSQYGVVDERLDRIANRMGEDTLKSEEAFNMGDFWFVLFLAFRFGKKMET